VWVDSVTEITNEDLNAEDEDTIPEQMEYIITQPSNGHLALKTAPNRPIMNFTQAHIDQRQLLFVHSGEISLNHLNLFFKIKHFSYCPIVCTSSVSLCFNH